MDTITLNDSSGGPMPLPDFLARDEYGFVHFTGHRIGLIHLFAWYNKGYSAEMLRHEYPGMRLATIHKGIAFYLENKAEVDDYIARERAEIDRQIAEYDASPDRGPTADELRRRWAAMHKADSERIEAQTT